MSTNSFIEDYLANMGLNLDVWDRSRVISPAQSEKLRYISAMANNLQRDDSLLMQEYPEGTNKAVIAAEALMGMFQQGIIDQRQREHLQAIVDGNTHPQTGLPCYCGDTHVQEEVAVGQP